MNRAASLIEETEKMIDDIGNDPMYPSDIAGEFAEEYRSNLCSKLRRIPNPTAEEMETISDYIGSEAQNLFERKLYHDR